MIIKVIPLEQTPEVKRLYDPLSWIQDNKILLDEFLKYMISRDDAAGLAANQVSVDDERLMADFFAIRDAEGDDSRSLVIAPVVQEYIGEPVLKSEGCLTWPGMTIVAERYPEIRVSYWTQEGRFIENELVSGFKAQVWQHEVNHLRGVKEEFLQATYKRDKPKVGRNDPCPCGSGVKYKKCCA
jgi:peptide deformylase